MKQKPATKVQTEQLKPAADDSARLAQIRTLVGANNKSTLDTDLVICQIYMESRFDAQAGAGQDAHGLMQMQRQGVQQVYKYRKQKELGHMPSDAQTKAAFAAGSAMYDSADIFNEATNIQLGTEYMQYWLDTSPSVAEAYAKYRGVSNGIYYKKISTAAARLGAEPTNMQILRDMVK